MKRKLLSILAGMACAFGAYAVPAMPTPAKVLQPDGTYVTVQLHGDEFFNFTTTVDGYTVERNADGYYVYMQKVDGALVQSTQMAHDVSDRTAEESAFLAEIETNLVSDDAQSTATVNRAKANQGYATGGLAVTPKVYDYSKFRGLVILAEFTDRTFSRTDANEIFTNMITQRNYVGLPSETDSTSITAYTGSVRDYFYDNSLGKFDAQFDVVGPVTINYTDTYINQVNNARTVMSAVMDAADSLVNFSDYDRDGDGIVDMVFVIFAGYGSNYSGNNTRYIWPHMSYLSSKSLDGVTFGRYACNCELYGWESGSHCIDGIGTFCHEFSHVLGMMDEYDTSGGTCPTPDTWSLMSGGSYNNYARTPCAYSLLQRYQAGFTVPTLIESAGEYTLRPIADYNEGYRINSGQDKEYFLFENRRKSGWDEYVQGSGMLVYRVDSTSTTPWSMNTINANANHPYYELLRATPSYYQYGGSSYLVDSSGDPFPGSGSVTSITNSSSPANLLSWTEEFCPFEVTSITASGNNVNFIVTAGTSFSYVESFENITPFTGDATDVQGEFANWNFSSAIVQNYGSILSNGSRSAGVSAGGYIATSTGITAENIVSVSFQVWNPNSSAATLHFYTSLDNGETWTEQFESGATEASTIKAGRSATTFTYPLGISNQYILIKIGVEGSFTGRCNVDYIEVVTSGGELSDVKEVVSGLTEDEGLAVTTYGTTAYVTSAEDADVEVYTVGGVLVARVSAVEAAYGIELPQRGFYIVRQGGNFKKIAL